MSSHGYSRNRKRINSRVSKCNQVLGRCSIRKISSISSRNCLETCLTSVQRYCRSSWPLRSRRLCRVRPQISGGKCGRDDMMRTLDGWQIEQWRWEERVFSNTVKTKRKTTEWNKRRCYRDGETARKKKESNRGERERGWRRRSWLMMQGVNQALGVSRPVRTPHYESAGYG